MTAAASAHGPSLFASHPILPQACTPTTTPAMAPACSTTCGTCPSSAASVGCCACRACLACCACWAGLPTGLHSGSMAQTPNRQGHGALTFCCPLHLKPRTSPWPPSPACQPTRRCAGRPAGRAVHPPQRPHHAVPPPPHPLPVRPRSALRAVLMPSVPHAALAHALRWLLL